MVNWVDSVLEKKYQIVYIKEDYMDYRKERKEQVDSTSWDIAELRVWKLKYQVKYDYW